MNAEGFKVIYDYNFDKVGEVIILVWNGYKFEAVPSINISNRELGTPTVRYVPTVFVLIIILLQNNI
jgi:hypothetical protein